MLRLFLTKMSVTMTPQFWQQTQNYITKKYAKMLQQKSFCKNAKIQHFDEFFDKICCFIFDEGEMTFWRHNPLESSDGVIWEWLYPLHFTLLTYKQHINSAIIGVDSTSETLSWSIL